MKVDDRRQLGDAEPGCKVAYPMNAPIAQGRRFSMKVALTIIVVSACALGAEAFLAFGLGFAPGWANGWPGISKHTVFAAVFSGGFSLALFAVGAVVFAVPCSIFDWLINRDYVGWRVFLSLMLAWAPIAAFLGFWVYPALRAGIAKEWP
jgi:hypothetical protein